MYRNLINLFFADLEWYNLLNLLAFVYLTIEG